MRKALILTGSKMAIWAAGTNCRLRPGAKGLVKTMLKPHKVIKAAGGTIIILAGTVMGEKILK